MNPQFIRLVQGTLPDIPEEVIRSWFEHGESSGWPTLDALGVPLGRWRKVLGERPLEYWRTRRWRLAQVPVAVEYLEQDSRQTVQTMIAAYLVGLPCPPGMPIVDFRPRIEAFREMIRATGTFPVSPIFLVHQAGYEVLDGFHRLAALGTLAGTGGLPREHHAGSPCDQLPDQL